MQEELFPHYHRWVFLQTGEDTYKSIHLTPVCNWSHDNERVGKEVVSCPCEECLDAFEDWLLN